MTGTATDFWHVCRQPSPPENVSWCLCHLDQNAAKESDVSRFVSVAGQRNDSPNCRHILYGRRPPTQVDEKTLNLVPSFSRSACSGSITSLCLKPPNPCRAVGSFLAGELHKTGRHGEQGETTTKMARTGRTFFCIRVWVRRASSTNQTTSGRNTVLLLPSSTTTRRT